MKQIIISKYGPPSVLQVQDAPNPIPRKNQVLIRNYFSGINFSEIMARMRLYPGAPKPPTSLGGEGCGIIEAVGDDVKKFKKGDKVMVLSRHGSYSTHICSNENLVMPLSENFSFEEGAAFPVIYLTAYMMMFNLGNFQKNETILIHGAGGGVGTAAIQLAQAIGGNIIGTASYWKHEKLNEMGIENCIDYTNENVYEKVMQFTNNRGVDIIIDPVGSDNWKISYECLAPLGKMIIFGDQNFVKGKSFNLFALMKEMFSMPKYKPMDLMSKNKSVMGYHLGRLAGAEDKIQEAASKLYDLAQAGKIKPIIDKVFPYTDAPQAHDHIQNRKNFGKVLLDFNGQ
tara:strand:- start:1485 stop:2510 length:1026 start_codon:yes stop_codon:yes gene_type:complete